LVAGLTIVVGTRDNEAQSISIPGEQTNSLAL
jgi:hypothetical protein